jgi:hypothetical protein
MCYVYEIPEVIFERALKADGGLLPKKSRPLYEKELHRFDDWRNKNSVKTVNETVLMGYFDELLGYLKKKILIQKLQQIHN